MIVKITCDGSVTSNPGPGGWACVFRANGVAKSLYGFDPFATNNKMELTAAIRGLEHLKKPCEVRIFCDSEYIVKGITKWITNWKKNGWVTAESLRGQSTGNIPAFSSKFVKNQELWQRLDKARERHDCLWHHVRGHDKDEDNILCDQIARRAAYKQIEGTCMLTGIDTNVVIRQAKNFNEDNELVRTISFQDV